MRVGIVGNGADKFTPSGKDRAIRRIHELLSPTDIVVSGRSPVGGIDIWAEEVAEELGLQTDIKEPKQHRWEAPYGYKARNLDIAKSDIVHVIVADVYPEEYSGRRFNVCYHCARNEKTIPDFAGTHVKSGGCWTGYKAIELGNRAKWHIVRNYAN